MTNQIAVPETVQFYYGKKVNYEAINLILNQAKPPKDSTWEELDEFYGARLAAQKTQYDLWCFLRETAKALWEGKIAALAQCNEIEMVDYDGDHLIDTVWAEKEFYQTYTISEKYEFFIGCEIGDTDDLYLWFYFMDDKENFLSDDWELRGDWDTPDDNIIYSKIKIPVARSNIVDLEPFDGILNEIFQKVSKYCLD